MKILHHGAVNGVTGSCHELRLANGSGILIDCGLFQGDEVSKNEDAKADLLTIDFPIDHIKALIVTHVHIDHVGRIPYLLAAGFKGPIYCSYPTAKLLSLVLEDALKIGVTRDKDTISRFITLIGSRIKAVPYKQWVNVIEGLDIRLQQAGHILGSAFVECRCHEDSTNKNGKKKTKKVIFSGDLGAPHATLLPAPKSPYGTDVLVIESTYGDQIHEGRALRRKRLQQIIEKAVQNRGTVLIPAFSIGRTQELLYELEGIIHDERRRSKTPKKGSKKDSTAVNVWSEIDIIVDSPLASRFTKVYRSLKPYWDKEALRVVQRGRHPLSFESLLTIDSHSDHLKTVQYLARSGRPAIVIAASGMCAGGRIISYLKALLPDPRTDVIFVGYQAAGTPGRIIKEYGPRGGYVYLDHEKVDIKAEIHTLSGYSAHADQQNLLNFVKRMRKKPREIRIIHGDDEAKHVLQGKMKELFPAVEVIIP